MRRTLLPLLRSSSPPYLVILTTTSSWASHGPSLNCDRRSIYILGFSTAREKIRSTVTQLSRLTGGRGTSRRGRCHAMARRLRTLWCSVRTPDTYHSLIMQSPVASPPENLERPASAAHRWTSLANGRLDVQPVSKVSMAPSRIRVCRSIDDQS